MSSASKFSYIHTTYIYSSCACVLFHLSRIWLAVALSFSSLSLLTLSHFFFPYFRNRFVSRFSLTLSLWCVRSFRFNLLKDELYLCAHVVRFLLHLFYNGINNITQDAEDSLHFVCTFEFGWCVEQMQSLCVMHTISAILHFSAVDFFYLSLSLSFSVFTT